MPRVGWVTDETCFHGGRQFTIKNFKDAKPEGIELVDIDLTKPEECDSFIVHTAAVPKNLPLFSKTLKSGTSKLKPIFFYAHQWETVSFGAKVVFYQSPLHSSIHTNGIKEVLPPPIVESDYKTDLDLESVDAELWVGSFNPGEGIDISIRIGEAEKRLIHYYGFGVPSQDAKTDTAFAKFFGPVSKESMPRLYAQHRKMIYNGRAPHPFGRVLAEAILAGMSLEVSGKLGILSFETDPKETAALCLSSGKLFWDKILDFMN